MTQEKGKLLIFSAPSGAGKTTIVHHLLEVFPELEFSVSATSRPPRAEEQHGEDYYFFSAEEFRERVSNGEFVEWEEVYAGQFYGTLQSEVERIWRKGHHVIFDVDVKGGLKLKHLFGERALAVFIMPPSVEALEQRLRSRGTETEEKIRVRMSKAKHELEFATKFDKIILNDKLERALKIAEQHLYEFLELGETSKFL